MTYVGKLKSNGKIFDSNIGKKPFEFRLGELLRSLLVLFQLMKYSPRYGHFAPFGVSLVGKETGPKAFCLGFTCDGGYPCLRALGMLSNGVFPISIHIPFRSSVVSEGVC